VPVTPPAKDPGAAKPPPKKDNGDAAAPSEADEKKASDLLRRARLFATDADNKEYYRSRLKEITSKYPGTAAAKEAEKLLKDTN
jgi:TolA-binding protein